MSYLGTKWKAPERRAVIVVTDPSLMLSTLCNLRSLAPGHSIDTTSSLYLSILRSSIGGPTTACRGFDIKPNGSHPCSAGPRNDPRPRNRGGSSTLEFLHVASKMRLNAAPCTFNSFLGSAFVFTDKPSS